VIEVADGKMVVNLMIAKEDKAFENIIQEVQALCKAQVDRTLNRE
jgi:hypothetical protein